MTAPLNPISARGPTLPETTEFCESAEGRKGKSVELPAKAGEALTFNPFRGGLDQALEIAERILSLLPSAGMGPPGKGKSAFRPPDDYVDGSSDNSSTLTATQIDEVAGEFMNSSQVKAVVTEWLRRGRDALEAQGFVKLFHSDDTVRQTTFTRYRSIVQTWQDPASETSFLLEGRLTVATTGSGRTTLSLRVAETEGELSRGAADMVTSDAVELFPAHELVGPPKEAVTQLLSRLAQSLVERSLADRAAHEGALDVFASEVSIRQSR